MPSTVDLLDPAAQRALQNALAQIPQLERYVEALDPETKAALAVIGGHPDDLRDVTVAIAPPAARGQMDAYRLIDKEPAGDRSVWKLTPEGQLLASTLAAAVEPPSESDQEAAREKLRRLIEEGNRDLESDS